MRRHAVVLAVVIAAVLVHEHAWAQSLVAAVLPSSRSVQVGKTATAFATVINSGASTATGCGLAPITNVPAVFLYQTTNPLTNQLTGSPNTPVNIPAGQAQSFLFAFTPNAPIAPTDVAIQFSCANASAAPVVPGLNTLLLSASSTPIPDIVALGATTNQDGIVNIAKTAPLVGAFAVATVNIGASGSITASADTGQGTPPVTVTICQTNPTTGVCLAPPTSSVTTQINANATPTFGIFVTGIGSVPFDPGVNRIFVRYTDGGGTTRGSTSVAVRTENGKLVILTSGLILPTAGGLLNVSSTDPRVNGASLSIPARAVAQSVTAHLGTVDTLPAGSPVGENPVGALFVLDPSGVTFSDPATLTLPIPTGIDRSKLHVSVFDEVTRRWINLGGTVSGDFISVQTTHFSTYGVFPGGKSTVRLVNATTVDTTNIPITVAYIAGPVPPPNTPAGAVFPAFPPLPPGGIAFRQGEERLVELLPGQYHFVVGYPRPQPGVANSLLFQVPVLASGADDGQVDQTITITDAGASSTDPTTNGSINFPGRAIVPGTNTRPVIACSAAVPAGVPIGSGDPTNPSLPSRIVNIGPIKLEEFQQGNPVTLFANATDPEGANLSVFWTVRNAFGQNVVATQGTASGVTVNRQCGKDHLDCSPRQGGIFTVFATAYDNFNLFDECHFTMSVVPNTPPTIAVIVDDIVIDFGRLDAAPNIPGPGQPDRRVIGVGPEIFGTSPAPIGTPAALGAPLAGPVPPFWPVGLGGGGLGPLGQRFFFNAAGFIPFTPGGAAVPWTNLCGYVNTIAGNTTVLRLINTIEGPLGPPHVDPRQYPAGMTCVFARVADVDGDQLRPGGFVLPLPIFGSGNLYTAIAIPPGAPFPMPANTPFAGMTVGQLIPAGLPVGAAIDNEVKMQAYNATLVAAANAGLLTSQFAANGALVPIGTAGVGAALPVIFEAPDDPDPALSTHDCRHPTPQNDLTCQISRGGVISVEARITDGFSPEQKAFGSVIYPDPAVVFPAGVTLGSVTPNPVDPGPGQGVTVTACIVPPFAGVRIDFRVVGTDGFVKTASPNTGTGGCADFFIPGGAAGVVDVVTVTVPVQTGVVAPITTEVTYAF